MEHTAHAERVLRLVLRAVRDFIVERTKAFGSMAIRCGARIVCGKPEDFGKWVFGVVWVCHVGERLGSEGQFFEQITFVR